MTMTLEELYTLIGEELGKEPAGDPPECPGLPDLPWRLGGGVGDDVQGETGRVILTCTELTPDDRLRVATAIVGLPGLIEAVEQAVGPGIRGEGIEWASITSEALIALRSALSDVKGGAV